MAVSDLYNELQTDVQLDPTMEQRYARCPLWCGAISVDLVICFADVAVAVARPGFVAPFLIGLPKTPATM